MNSEKQHIAVVGAGLAASVFSAKMTAAGHQITVFEKSRGTGGRLSSCRLDDASADLGAPFLKVSTPEFQHWLTEQNDTECWQPRTGSFTLQDLGQSEHWLVQGRQSALTRRLLSSADLRTEVRVGKVTLLSAHTRAQPKVQLFDIEGHSLGIFDQVVITAPAPQAVALLTETPSLQKIAAAITPSVSWMLVLKLKTTSGLNFDLIKGQHPILRRCIKDSSKPKRTPRAGSEIWVLEANEIWSQQHQDTDKAEVQRLLLNAFHHLQLKSSGTTAEVESSRVHRWLYSRHHSPSPYPIYLWDQTAGIAACGDWLDQGEAEAAWRSANTLAERMLDAWSDT